MGEYAATLLETIQKAYNKIAKEKKKTTQGLKILDQLKEKLTDKKKNKKSFQEAASKLQEEARGYADRLISLKTSIEKIKSEIPERLQDKAKLEEHIKDLEKTIQEFKTAYDKTQKEMEQLVSQKIQAETTQKGTELQLKEVVKRHKNEREKFNLQIEKAGFITFEAYQNAYASQDVLEALDTEIKTYTKQKNTLEAQYKKLEEETKGMIFPNIEELQQAPL